MPLTINEKHLIARQIRIELPEIKIEKNKLKVRQYQIDDLVEFIYNIYKKGECNGRKKIKKELYKKLKIAVKSVLSDN